MARGQSETYASTQSQVLQSKGSICNRLETEEPAAVFCVDFCAVLLCRFKVRMGEIPEPRRQTCINQRDDIS